MGKRAGVERVLGLDLGANSIGWALIEFQGQKPTRIVDTGVRVFEAGVDGQLEQGREESRGVQRRLARQRRRQLDRQARRMANLAAALQTAGLLPEGDVWRSETRDQLFKDLDRKLYTTQKAKGNGSTPADILDQLPYYLRTLALDEPLAPYEIGRALYHLAQRRGFKSNRKNGSNDDEKGEVKPKIAELDCEMHATGARTLGEYLGRLNPHEKRIRQRWTSRTMYEDEFDAIWEAQRRHHPDLFTPTLEKELKQTIFYQRPLKSARHLVGRCELEPNDRRCPWALLPAQRFRILQRVNDLEVISRDGLERRRLTSKERATLIGALERQEEMTFGKMRTLLKLKGTTFNFESGDDEAAKDKSKGNTTAVRMRKVFGDRWDDFSLGEQQQLISEVMGIPNEAAVIRRGQNVWGLDGEAAKRLAEMHLENGYCRHSKRALKRILPLMEDGMRYQEAVRDTYGEDQWIPLELEELPAVEETKAITLRNPTVMRVLTELRKVVNAVIRRHAKPQVIRIELARDLKRARPQRQKLWRKNRERRSHREQIKNQLLSKTGIQSPRGDDIVKALLAEECNWECPFTKTRITWGNLFGDQPQFDIEHIIPFSRCLDDSFMNKTLCYHEENRYVKRNRTPWEAYGELPEYEEILQRVGRFKGDAAAQKLARFQKQKLDEIEDFVSSQLNDTRYASKEAKKFVGLLYGTEAPHCVQATTGQVTEYLRRGWKLNGILNDGDVKTRDDHRHHAVDAICTALTNRSTMKQLSDAARQAELEKGRVRGWAKLVEPPWDGFFQDVSETIRAIPTSHRVNRRVRGRLHEDTNYSAPRIDEDGKSYVAVRKPLDPNFTPAMANTILDPAIRRIVVDHLSEHKNNPKKAFANRAALPRDFRGRTIRHVRIRKTEPVFSVGSSLPRYVSTDSNHHVEIIETTDKKGRPKWEGHVVSRYEAARRQKNDEPVIKRNHGDGKVFKFSLALNECVRMKNAEGNPELYRVIGLSQFSSGAVVLDFRKNDDARPISQIPKKGRTRTPEPMRKAGAEKVSVDLMGDIVQAND